MAIAICAREFLKDVALPVAGAIGGDVKLVEHVDVVKRFRALISDELAEELDRAFDDALEREVRRALNSEDLGQEFPDLVMRFWARLSLPLVELSTELFKLSADSGALELVKDIELDLGRVLSKVIKGSGYRYAEDLVYGLSVLIDRDVWVMEKMSKYGFDGVVKLSLIHI